MHRLCDVRTCPQMQRRLAITKLLMPFNRGCNQCPQPRAIRLSGRAHSHMHHSPCRSLYLIKQAMNVQPASKYELHMCPNPKCAFVWDQLLRADYHKHRNERCPKCFHGRRFKNKRGAPEPSKRYESSLHCLRSGDMCHARIAGIPRVLSDHRTHSAACCGVPSEGSRWRRSAENALLMRPQPFCH